MQTSPCLRCGNPVPYDPEIIVVSCMTIMCEPCIGAAHRERVAKGRAEWLRKSWLALCPLRYQDTVLEQLPYPEKSAEVLRWKFEKGIGLNLWGFPDTGKTRGMFLVLHQLHNQGKSIRCFGPGDFAIELSSRDFKRAPWIKSLMRIDVLAFDDMDKMSLTRDQELVFFALLDKRMSQERPCLFTHNSTANDLEYKFRNGKAMVRRIRQFSKSFHFPERQQSLL